MEWATGREYYFAFALVMVMGRIGGIAMMKKAVLEMNRRQFIQGSSSLALGVSTVGLAWGQTTSEINGLPIQQYAQSLEYARRVETALKTGEGVKELLPLALKTGERLQELVMATVGTIRLTYHV